MNCPNCHSPIPDDSRFCKECGSSVSGGSGLEQERTLSDDQTIMAPGEGTHDPQTGPSQTTAHYQILEQIGQGGMGTVYRARDTKLDIEVALKRLSSEMAESEQGVRRFLNEAKTIARLNHQNIVRVITIGEDDQGHYIVMDLIDGQDLGRVIQQRGALDLDEAMDLFRGICNGVSYAHKRGVIHRDIKPSNVLLMSDGTPKLVDFGLARIGRESDLSMTGYGLGTMAYMSPEQRRDAKHVDHRSDIFALAKTFYHMITGDVPDAVDIDEIPAGIRPALLRALKPKFEDRFFSVDEFWTSLEGGAGSGLTPVTADSGAAADSCAECGHVNAEGVRFCQTCGSGLFEVCPAPGCEYEQRSGIEFCGGCGTNIQKYRQFHDHLSAARGYWEQGKYSRVIKEANSGLSLNDESSEMQQLLRDATEQLAALDDLKAKLGQAIEAGKLTTAAELVDGIEEFAPDDKDARHAREQIQVRSKQLSAKLAEARSCLEQKNHKQAALIVEACVALNSESPDVERIVLEVSTDQAWLEDRLKDAKRYLSEGHHDEARLQAEEILSRLPDHPRAKGILVQVQHVVEREAWRSRKQLRSLAVRAVLSVVIVFSVAFSLESYVDHQHLIAAEAAIADEGWEAAKQELYKVRNRFGVFSGRIQRIANEKTRGATEAAERPVELSTTRPAKVPWQFIRSGENVMDFIDTQLAEAKAAGKPVMFDFWAVWCAYCKKLDKNVWNQASVVEESLRFTTIKVDATRADAEMEAVYERFDVSGLPMVVFVDSQGNHLVATSFTGYKGPEEILEIMKSVK